MKVLLCGEGPHDIGHADCWDQRLSRYVSLEGWMQPFVRHVLGGRSTFSVRKRVELQLFSRESLPRGHGAKAYLAKRAAVLGGYDLVIFMVDADSNQRGKWRQIVDEINAGFDALAEEVWCIACVPMAASESWLLSDARAWARAAGYDGADLPRRPEAIWGPRDDPSGNHPHRYFARICDTARVDDDMEIRALIAGAISLSTARASCPVSMEPFLSALEHVHPDSDET